ncbi:UbiA prenyltransferase family protein [Aquimarina sp. 2201CG5-10]|uniref:UbiA prenyltransferase family protein n=1 Tax=Aquimarina callyspongiae TaxID=3098150 RepID=UPI002AB4286D|nr:UbiA prenyltransferase family protein [Aquimarina sp. 2201CG5-10]MDY8135848.1 UbiA prenyltransferase family protein [Aquimarina sp. 2201CG5-10]
MKQTIRTYSSLLRLDNYIKNLFVFAPLFFDFQFRNELIINSFISFILFCFLASSMYIFNDIFDFKADKQHPVKKFRSIPSGKISINKAIIIGTALLFIVLGISFIISLQLFYVFLSYVFINISYNIVLKKIPIIDVLVISFGFVLRILAGSYATHIPASGWILIMTFLLSLFLGFTKRRADIVLASNNGIKVSNIQIFSISSINKIVYFLSITITVVYIMYTLSKEVVERIGKPYVFITAIWVLLGIMRYLKIIMSSKNYKDPTAIVIKDWILQSIILLWVLTFVMLKYL